MSPSLAGYAESKLDDAYESARLRLLITGDVPEATIPERCPFTPEQVFADYWLPA